MTRFKLIEYFILEEISLFLKSGLSTKSTKAFKTSITQLRSRRCLSYAQKGEMVGCGNFLQSNHGIIRAQVASHSAHLKILNSMIPPYSREKLYLWFSSVFANSVASLFSLLRKLFALLQNTQNQNHGQIPWLYSKLKKLRKETPSNSYFAQNILGENLPIGPFTAFGSRETAQKSEIF